MVGLVAAVAWLMRHAKPGVETGAHRSLVNGY